MPAPTAYTAFNSKPGTFACEYPEGWQAEGGGKRGLEWAKFTSGPAEIRVDTGVGASLIGDIASSAAKMDGEETPEEAPILAVHAAYTEDFEKDYKDYKEVTPVEEIDINMGPMARNEFTASGTFGSGLHGYRATALTGTRAYSSRAFVRSRIGRRCSRHSIACCRVFKRGVAE